jgi:hypothetical protein
MLNTGRELMHCESLLLNDFGGGPLHRYLRLLYCRNLRATVRQRFLAYRRPTQAASALPIYGGVD